MQDWSYIHGGALELTLEVGCYKYPKAEELSKYWIDNREALIKYIEQSHIGIKGFVKSTIGNPIQHAAISINNIQHVTYTSKDGDYFRLLLPGKYNITVTAKGYESQTSEIIVPDSGNSQSKIFTFSLMRNDPQHWSSAYDFRILENILHTKYHSNREVEVVLRDLQHKNPLIAQFEEDDNSQYYSSLKVTDGIGETEETKIHIMLMSSLFETSVLGREMILNIARHIVTAYNTREPLMIQLLKNTVIHFVTINTKFDNVYEQFERNVSICDPHLNEELGDKLLNAESDSTKIKFFKLFEKDEISLALTFTAGDDNNVQILKDREPVYSQFAQETQSHLGAQNQVCSSNTMRLNENDSLKKITNLLYNMFSLPLYTINLSCCKMPSEKDIADIWRENIERILKFINLGRSGVKGFVRDQHGNPLRNARVKVSGSQREYKVSKNLAFFHVLIPKGSCQLEIICDNFTTKLIDINFSKEILDLKEIILQSGTSQKSSSSSSNGKHYSVSGYVVDQNGTPIDKAEIGVKGNWRKQAYTNKVGQFEMDEIDIEEPTLTVNAQGFKRSEKLVTMKLEGMTKNVIFKLSESDDNMGFSNLLFIFFICITILFSVVCVTCCAINGFSFTCPLGNCFGTKESRRHLMDNYKFSLLTRKTKKDVLFHDDVYGDDSDEEEELFNPVSLRGKKLNQFKIISIVYSAIIYRSIKTII